MFDSHVREAQDVLVGEELQQLDLAQSGDWKLGDSQICLAKAQVLGGTYTILLVVHDDLLDGDYGASLL